MADAAPQGSADPGSDSADRETGRGAAFALAAFGFWGLNPLYFKLVDHVPMLEVLAHRVLWSVVFLAALIFVSRRWMVIRVALRDRRTLLLLLLSTMVITANWLVYIWAMNVERVLETSLGYYINPLISVLLGVLVLGERLTLWQGVAVGLAALGVLNMALGVGHFPWVALSLALTFGLYALIRKTIKIESVDGLLVETSMLLPLALAFLIGLAVTAEGNFRGADPTLSGLLILAGPVTALPLIWFTSAARRLKLSTIGFFQYIAPTCQFLLAVFLFDEPFTSGHLITFALIWTALLVFSLQSLVQRRARGAV